MIWNLKDSPFLCKDVCITLGFQGCNRIGPVDPKFQVFKLRRVLSAASASTNDARNVLRHGWQVFFLAENNICLKKKNRDQQGSANAHKSQNVCLFVRIITVYVGEDMGKMLKIVRYQPLTELVGTID